MKNDLELKDRILFFLKYLKKGQTKFEEEVGLSRGAINNIKGGISSKSINKISEAYPELNTAWLLTGEGQMLKTGDVKNTISRNANAIGNVAGSVSGHNVVFNGNEDKKIIRQDEIEIDINRWENAEKMFLQKIASLESEIALLKANIKSKDETIEAQEKHIASQNLTIAAKDETIRILMK